MPGGVVLNRQFYGLSVTDMTYWSLIADQSSVSTQDQDHHFGMHGLKFHSMLRIKNGNTAMVTINH